MATGALVAAVAFHDAPLAALGLPSLFLLAAGSAADSRAASAEVALAVSIDPEVVHAGDEVRLSLVLTSDADVELALAILTLPPTVAPIGPTSWAARLRRDEPTELAVRLATSRPGAAEIGPLVLSLTGRGRLVFRTITVPHPFELDVRPAEERLRLIPRSARLRVPAGERLTRSTGDGLELADVRPHVPGERARRINWRATARRDILHVSVHHPEQSTDIVLFADTFAPEWIGRVLSTVSSAAAAYLLRRDRVGLVCFGGLLDWVEAGSGPRQLDRIRSRLAATSPFFSYSWKTLERIPPQALPRGSLVVAVTPLQDDRFIGAIGDLRARGHEVVVVELVMPGDGGPPAGTSASVDAARLLTRMEHEDLLHRLYTRGIAVMPLGPNEPVGGAFHALAEVRRRMRTGRNR